MLNFNYKMNYTTKHSVEYCVWNTLWRDVDNVRRTMRSHVEDHVDDEPLLKTINNVPRLIVNMLGSNVHFIGDSGLKSILNSELRERIFNLTISK